MHILEINRGEETGDDLCLPQQVMGHNCARPPYASILQLPDSRFTAGQDSHQECARCGYV